MLERKMENKVGEKKVREPRFYEVYRRPLSAAELQAGARVILTSVFHGASAIEAGTANPPPSGLTDHMLSILRNIALFELVSLPHTNDWNVVHKVTQLVNLGGIVPDLIGSELMPALIRAINDLSIAGRVLNRRRDQ